MKELRSRKPNRLKEYDYSQNGKYFITACAKNRLELFSSIAVGAAFCRPHNTDIGEIIENEIGVLARSYQGVSVDCYVIMPNHVHMIIGIERADSGRQDGGRQDGGRQNAAPTRTITQMVGQWKRVISMKIGYPIWQKSFHDHIIRNEAEYERIAKYIKHNPDTWMEDCFYQ